MERTNKVKIALGILLVLLAIRCVLGFFPKPLEFAPYTGEGVDGDLQTVSFTEIRYAMTIKPEGGKMTHYYLVQTTEGSKGLVSSATKYIDEVFESPVTFTGMLASLPNPDEISADHQEFFYSQITPSDSFLKEYGSKTEVYRALCDLPVLNRDFEETETDHPAAFWVSILAFAAFCWMLAMLLKEYSAGRKSKKQKEEAEKEEEEA